MWQGKMVPKEVAALEYFNESEATLKRGDIPLAIKKFEDFLVSFSDDSHAQIVHFKLGSIYYSQDKKDKAIENFGTLIKKFPKSEYRHLGAYYLARIFFDQKKYVDCLKTLQVVDYEKLTNRKRLLNYLKMSAISYRMVGNFSEAIVWYMKEKSYLGPGSRQKEIDKIMVDMLFNQLKLEGLLKIRNQVTQGYPAEVLLLKLVREYYQNEKFNKTLVYAREFISTHPESEFKEEVQDMLTKVEGFKRQKVNRIGVLLPLSGKYKVFGERILKGILLATKLLDQDQSSITIPELTLEIRDSQANAEVTKKQMDDLIINEGVAAVIGPISTGAAEVAAGIAQDYKVPIITLSQEEDVTKKGGFVFRNSLTKSAQIKVLVEFAINVLEINKFAVLYPEHPYGKEFADLFWKEVEANKAEVTAIASYEVKAKDFSKPIKKIIGKEDIKARAHEICGSREHIRGTVCYSAKKLPPIIDFQAIFIPDSYQNVSLIVPALPYADVTGVQLLGISTWNTENLIKRAGKQNLQGAIFTDAYFANIDNQQSKFFHEGYLKQYAEKPEILAILGYESMMILQQVIAGGVKDRRDLKKTLQKVSSFPGISGELAINKDGSFEREIYVLTVDRGKISQFPYENPVQE